MKRRADDDQCQAICGEKKIEGKLNSRGLMDNPMGSSPQSTTVAPKAGRRMD